MKANILYRLVDQNDKPFYIGITNNILRREKEHIKDFNNKVGSKFDGVESFTIEVLIINTNKKFNIKLLETFIIIYDKILGDKILKNKHIY